MVQQTSRYVLCLFLFAAAGCGVSESQQPPTDSRVLTDIPEIVAKLKSSDWHIRSLAASRLGMMGAEAREAIPDLEQVKKNDRDKRVRVAAQKAIAQIKNPPPNPQ